MNATSPKTTVAARDKRERVNMTELLSPGTDSPCPRVEKGSLTDRFAAAWPDVEAPLRRYLRSLGISGDNCDDLVQETAARVLRGRMVFADTADLRRYCFRIARNLRVDESRRQARYSTDSDLSAMASTAHADELVRVEDRHLLRTVAEYFRHLTPVQQEALLASSEGLTSAERNRLAVARFRARTRLAKMVGPLAGVISAVAVRIRQFTRSAARPVALAPLALVGALAFSAAVISGGGAIRETVRSPSLDDSLLTSPIHGGPSSAARNLVTAAQVGTLKIGRAGRTGPGPSLVDVTAPAKTYLRVGLRPKHGHEPLVCTQGVLNPKPICVALPTIPIHLLDSSVVLKQMQSPPRE